MKQIFLTGILIISGQCLFAQNTDNIVAQVENNNTTLITLRKEADAERIGNMTGLFPENPEVEFSYLWGSPVTIGNRKDLSIVQSFDFPTAYGYRSQISEYRNIQAGLEYEKQHNNIITRTLLICNELVFINAMRNELGRRTGNARRLAGSYKAGYEAGETGLIDYNKAQVYLLSILREAGSNEVERNALLAELAGLNGGTPLEFADTVFYQQPIPDDFEQWYVQAEEKNPVLQWLKQEVTISRSNEKLNTAMSLPKLQAGYMSEEVVGQQYKGVTFGLSIPLLENRNAVRYARAKTAAAQSLEADTKMQFYNKLKALHARATGLQESLDDYQENLDKYDNSGLLGKALAQGELSLIDYLNELALYYESIDRLVELRRSLNETVIELNRYR